MHPMKALGMEIAALGVLWNVNAMVGSISVRSVRADRKRYDPLVSGDKHAE